MATLPAMLLSACGPSTIPPGIVGLRDMTTGDRDQGVNDLGQVDAADEDGGGALDLGGDLARPWVDKSPAAASGVNLWAAWNSGTGTVLVSGDGAALYKSSNGAAFVAEPSTKPAAMPNLLSISSVAPGPPTNPMYLAGSVGSIWSYSGNIGAGSGSFTAEVSGTTNPLYGIWVASDGVAFAVGQEVALKRTTSWAPVTGGPTTGQASYNMWGAKTASGYSVYAVGAAGKIWHSNGGNYVVETSGTSNALYGVWGSGPNDVYVVGDIGTILHSTGNGTWTQQNSGTAVALEGIGGANASEIYIAGDNGTILHKTDPTSAIWDKETIPNAADTRDFFAVSATATEVYVVGQMGAILKR